MRKVVIHSPGGYDRLRLEECEVPKPGAGEVVVETVAIGVNYADCIVRMGFYKSAKHFVGWPITPGFEFAGVVVAVGEGVGLELGMEVFGVTLFGAYATHVVVEDFQVFPIPTGFSLEEAAAFPAVFLTAYYGVCELVRMRRGMKVLVHSAAGGVGTALLQLLKIGGCYVVGVVGGAHKAEVARKFGADEVIVKREENLWQKAEEFSPEGYDIILDANGVETLGESYSHLASSGRLVIYGFHTMLSKGKSRPSYFKLAWDYLRTPRFSPLNMTSYNKSVLAFNLSYLFHKKEILLECMADLRQWIEEGKIQAPHITTFPLEDVAGAQRALESGETVGKLVLLSGKNSFPK